MSKETDKKRKDEEDPELDEEQDEEEEDEEEDEEEGEEEDEEEEESASAKGASKTASADDDDEEDDEEDEDEEDDEEEEDDAHHGDEGGHGAQGDGEDPYWWTPHVVLGVLVLVGILGFFGMFNKPLGFLAAKPAGPAPETATVSAPATPPQPATPPRPLPRPDQAQQPQREMFGAKHFLVMFKGGMRAPANITRTKEEAKTRAEEGLKKIKAGAKFEQVVGEYSDEPGAGARGGDLGNFPKGAMVPQFQAAVEKMKVGEVSDLVETPFGYHVILRTK